MRDAYLRESIPSDDAFKVNQIPSELVLRGNDGVQGFGKVKRAISTFKIAAFVKRDGDEGSATSVGASSEIREKCCAKKRQCKFLEHVEDKGVNELVCRCTLQA